MVKVKLDVVRIEVDLNVVFTECKAEGEELKYKGQKKSMHILKYFSKID